MGNIQTVKLGVVGLGRGIQSVLDILSEPDVKLTAICDKDPEKIEQAKAVLAKDAGVTEYECYTDYEEFLRADTDAVVIATYANLHVPFVIKALNAGKHVISEIPAVNSLEEAKALKNAVAAHPELKYMCGENDCFLGFIEAWKTMYDEGKFGDIVYAEAEYLHSTDFREFSEEKTPKEHWRSYNPAIKYCTHDLGPLLYIMNDRCVSVSCMVPDTVYNPYIERVAENGVALFKTAKGAVIRILICFGAYVGYTHNYAMYGTRGMIEVDKSKPRLEAHSLAMLSDIPGSFNHKIDIPVTCSTGTDGGTHHMGLDRKMMRAFLNCIIKDERPPIDVDLAIRMALPGVFAHESYLNGGSAVAIPDVDEF